MAEEKLFDVEHALNICALSFMYLPAAWLYKEDILKAYAKGIARCHVYLIGLMPDIANGAIRKIEGGFITIHKVLGIDRELFWEVPEGWTLDASGIRLRTPEGDLAEFRMDQIVRRLGVNFEVIYVGQAFGEDGSRNAVDRLLQHGTLQRILAEGVPPGHSAQLLLLEVDEDNRVITVFDPKGVHKDDSGERIEHGLDKVFQSNEAELVTLYEASLIRYFQPKYNKIFKEHFPSSNQKVLADCYDKDFSSLLVELCDENFPFEIFSQDVSPSRYHMIEHDLHDDERRRLFFF